MKKGGQRQGRREELELITLLLMNQEIHNTTQLLMNQDMVILLMLHTWDNQLVIFPGIALYYGIILLLFTPFFGSHKFQ